MNLQHELQSGFLTASVQQELLLSGSSQSPYLPIRSPDVYLKFIKLLFGENNWKNTAITNKINIVGHHQ